MITSLTAMILTLSSISMAAPKYERHLVPVRHDGLRVAVHRFYQPKPSRGVVLILHGGSIPAMLSAGYRIDGRSWADDLASRGFDVWALDFIGYGDSDRYPEMLDANTAAGPVGRVDEAAEQVLKTIAFIRTHTRAPLSIVAHSWGTLVAGMVAARQDLPVRRLVLYGAITPPKAPDANAAMPERAFEDVTIEKQWAGFTTGIPPGHDPAIDRHLFDQWATAYLRSDVASGTRTPVSVRIPTGPDADYARVLRGWFPYDPATIRIPVLVARGTWDFVINAEDADRFLASLTASPEKRVVSLAEGTHRLHWERNRKQLYDEVALFLMEQP